METYIVRVGIEHWVVSDKRWRTVYLADEYVRAYSEARAIEVALAAVSDHPLMRAVDHEEAQVFAVVYA